MSTWSICLSCLGLALSLVTIAPELDMKSWWVRNWIYGRQQLFWLLLGLIILYVSTAGMDTAIEGGVLTVMSAACLFAFSSIAPYIPFISSQRKDECIDGAPLRLLIANVLQDNDRYSDLVGIIENADADIVFLSEVNQAWVDGLSAIKNKYKYCEELPGEDYNGLCVYSKCPIVRSETRCLVQDHVPSFDMDIALNDQTTMKFYAVHPRPPRPEDDPDCLDTELKILAHDAYACDMPVIVAGDMNEVGWSRALRRFRIMSGLNDAQRGRMICNSYNAKFPLVRWPLDHAYHSDAISVMCLKRLSKFGSDHFPILFDFSVSEPG